MTDRPYFIDASVEQRRTFNRLAALATALGFGEEFRRQTRAAWARLTADPRAWGDPLYNLHHMGLAMHRGLAGRLVVYYAIDEDRRIVYVREFVPAPGSGLDRPTP
jgi:hypothetical protein